MNDRYDSFADSFKKLDVHRVKTLSVLVIVLVTVYHGIIHAVYGRDSCGWLLADGRYQGNQVWQPYGCMLHVYSKVDAKQCLRKANTKELHSWIIYVGDSRIRQLFSALVTHIDGRYTDDNIELLADPSPRLSSRREANESQKAANKKSHINLLYENKEMRTTLEFRWMPVVNESFLALCKQLKECRPDVPDLVIAGSASWSIKGSNASAEALDDYRTNLTHVAEALDSLALYGTQVLWMLQDPVSPSLLSPNRAMITNEQIDAYNLAALQAFHRSRIRLWSSSRLVIQGAPSWFDGLHVGNGPIKKDLQILLNYYCNSYMQFKDGTCCSKAESFVPLQMFTYSLFLVCFMLCGAKAACHWKARPPPAQSDLPNGIVIERQYAITVTTNSVLAAFARLGIIMVYFLLCDRTTYFMKENKYFSTLNFWLPIGYILALGLFFNDQSKHTKFLHRDQTDEWRGWMQLVILVYHMTGASTILPIYVNMRALVTAYLFLTGYGHFYFAWHNGDVGFVRFVQVLFRMNFLALILCLCMNRPYQHYYYVSLVSFWFVIVYLTLALPPKVTAANSEGKPYKYVYIILKLVSLVAGINVLFMSEVFFEHIFNMPAWRWLFVASDGSVQEWWFRWSVDRYSVVFGMVFALLTVLTERHRLFDGLLTDYQFKITSFSIGILGLLVQFIFSFLCPTKEQCNEIHSYSAFVPIVSFVLLRNSFDALRRYFSKFYSWFGRISLELYVAQYHIWLAADSHGILVLIPGYPVANVVVTTFIFMCVSHEIHEITATVTQFFVPDDFKLVLRNLLILALLTGVIHLYGVEVSELVDLKHFVPTASRVTSLIS